MSLVVKVVFTPADGEGEATPVATLFVHTPLQLGHLLVTAPKRSYDTDNMASNDITVLVTGGAGYIGSHMVLLLLQNNYKVVVVDSCVNSSPPSSAGSTLPPSLDRVAKLCGKEPIFCIDNMMDQNSLTAIMKKHQVQAVVHFAALKAVGESIQNPLSYYKNNLAATLNLLQSMEESGIHSIIFSSSATVYGSPVYLPIDENHPVGQNITNPYGQSKYMAERILTDVATANKKWKVILLRYFNPVGAHESGIIGENPVGVPNNLMPFIAQVAVGKREKLKVFGDDFKTKDGTGVRDYIHVMDLSQGHVNALNLLFSANYKGCHAYNLGTGKGVSVKQMISAFEKSSSTEIKYEIAERRPGDCAEIVASCRKAEVDLKWSAKKSLQDMCDDTWRWQKSNPNGYV